MQGSVAVSTIAQVADRIEFHPFIPARTVTINELAIDVSTNVAATNCKAAIYSDNGSGAPNALLAGTADLSCATTGVKTGAVSSLTLTAGTIYWFAVHSSSTQTLRGIPLSALLPIGVSNAANLAHFTSRRGTSSYAGGLPSVAPTSTPGANIAPMVRARLV